MSHQKHSIIQVDTPIARSVPVRELHPHDYAQLFVFLDGADDERYNCSGPIEHPAKCDTHAVCHLSVQRSAHLLPAISSSRDSSRASKLHRLADDADDNDRIDERIALRSAPHNRIAQQVCAFASAMQSVSAFERSAPLMRSHTHTRRRACA